MASEPKRCRIEETLGMDAVCPVDLEDNAQIAEWLVRVRKIIEAERAA